MELKTYFAQDAAGNIISSAIVNVFLQGTTTLATGLTRADGTPLENPFAADGAGRIQFRAPDGYYDVQVSAGSAIIQTLTIQCVDYSGAKADADRAEDAADRADISAAQVADAIDLRGDLANPAKGDSLMAVQAPFTGSVPRTLHDKNAEIISPHDFDSSGDLIHALIARGKSAAVFNSYHVFTLTVGTDGDYPNLMAAIVAAQAMRPLWGGGQAYCEIRLKAGYIMNAQMEFGAGVDLSWIKITSEDAIVSSDTTAFTKQCGPGQSLGGYRVAKYMFHFSKRAQSPVFAFLMEENRNNSDVTAFVFTEGAVFNNLPGSGARKFLRAIETYYAHAYTLFSNGAADPAVLPVGTIGFDASYSKTVAFDFIGSTAFMPLIQVHHAGTYGVFAYYGSNGNFPGGNASYCQVGWVCRDNSSINIRDHNSTFCTTWGIQCIHNAMVNARRHDTEETDVATSGMVLNAAAQNGFYGCANGVRMDGTGGVEVAGNDMRNISGIVINADTAGTITGKAVDMSGSNICFDCHAGGQLSFPRLWAQGVNKLLALDGGVRFSSAVIHTTRSATSTETRFLDGRNNSHVDFTIGDMDSSVGCVMDSGSSLTLNTINVAPLVLSAQNGSRINMAINCTFNPKYITSGTMVRVDTESQATVGNTVTTTGVPLTFNVNKNTLTASGYICAP